MTPAATAVVVMAMSWTHNAAWPRRATLQPELSSPRVMLPHAALADVEPKPGRAASAGLPTELPPAMSPIDAGSIIAGTAIGGGFLALPYVTTPVGYLPSVCGLVAVWVFLLSAALALIEAAGLVADEQLQVREDDASAAGDAPSAEFTLSVATVIRHVFGPRAATMAGGAFMAQMLAVMTAQVVKGAEILAKFTPMSYHLGCVAPAALVGLFTFSARPKVVERANTGLTVAMLAGFGALIAAAVSLGGGAAARVALARADWPLLLPLPSAGTAWAIPVFINLLCFGQAIPLLVEGVVMRAGALAAEPTDADADRDADREARHAAARRARNAALLKLRVAVVCGSLIPLLLSLVWAAISATLVATTSGSDLILSLLGAHAGVAVPVGLLAAGAIGTTLISSFLAMSHFAADVFCTVLGFCSLRWMRAARILTIALPCGLACAGPGLYLPLLAFSGAYPTTILYGLAPPLAVLVLRRTTGAAHTADKDDVPSLLPGGPLARLSVTAVASALLCASSALNVRRLLRLAV